MASTTVNYSGTFLSCYADNNTSCVHAIKDHTLVYVYAGQLLVNDNGVESMIYPGECIFIRRDHRVQMTKLYTDTEQYRGVTMTFKRNFIRDFYNNMDKKVMIKDIKKPTGSTFKMPLSADITSLFQSLKPYLESVQQPTENIIKLKEQEGIYCLLNANKDFYSILFDFTEPWKIDILDFMNENYMYEFSMDEIASYTGRSLATFKRDFSKISDLTPNKWLINKRLEVAYDMIKNKNEKASDVYTEVGFKNISHFYSAFKKQFGFTPANKKN